MELISQSFSHSIRELNCKNRLKSQTAGYWQRQHRPPRRRLSYHNITQGHNL